MHLEMVHVHVCTESYHCTNMLSILDTRLWTCVSLSTLICTTELTVALTKFTLPNTNTQ